MRFLILAFYFLSAIARADEDFGYVFYAHDKASVGDVALKKTTGF
jgi:hypothetical protein